MAYRNSNNQKSHRVSVQPINVIFRHLQNRTKVSVWLQYTDGLQIEGIVRGFDEYMNIILDESEEVLGMGTVVKRKSVGRILLKGDTIAAVHPVLDKDANTGEGEHP